MAAYIYIGNYFMVKSLPFASLNRLKLGFGIVFLPLPPISIYEAKSLHASKK